MDRGRRPAALAVALAGLALAAASDTPPLAEMRWLAPGADPAKVLTVQPAECLAATSPAIEVGRAAFRSPLLLGGQAARAGLSCESCHRNGRGNPDFRFPGISGAPGTADVTSSLFSSHRGDGVDDPRVIPDLGGPKAALKVSQAPDDRALETFIHGLVVEEFDGPEPPAAVLDGLAAYVRALVPCPATPTPLTADVLVADAGRAVRAASTLLARNDSPAALVMIAAARARLGRLDERYAGLPRSRAALARSSRDLAEIAALVRASDAAATVRLEAWSRREDGLRGTLARDESRSFFNPSRLRLPEGGA